ncbi:MAG: cellulase family glycosylhydrolase [Chloroflexota bacterium]
MHRLIPFLLLTSLLFAACRQAPAQSSLPDPTTPTAPSVSTVTAVPTAVPPTIAVTEQVFLPLTGGQESITATPEPEAAVLPTDTPAPTATPAPQYPPYAGPPLDRDDIGIQIYLHRQDMRDLVRHFQALDVGWVKVQVSWKLYEPRPGEYSEERFAELDRLVDATDNNDIKLLLNVSKAPEWSRSTTEEDGPPSDFGQFESFMTYLATRYQGRVAAYELWNEPNLRREWNGSPLDPALLVDLTRQGADGIHAADPGALIISAAPATTGINDGVSAVDDRVYLRGMLAAGIAGVVDGIGVHPYGWANPPEASAADTVQKAPSHNNHPSFFFSDTMQDYRALLVEYGAADRSLWATEFGWGTFEHMTDDQGNPASPPAGAEFMNNVSEWDQALYIMDAFALAHNWEWAGPMFLWNLNFAPGIGSAFSESGYSILRSDAARRPAYLSLEHRNE